MTIDPKFIEKAHALCNEEETCDWDSGELHSSSCNGIARALQDARDDENRACEEVASRRLRYWEENPTTEHDLDLERIDESGRIAGSIAARRGPG